MVDQRVVQIEEEVVDLRRGHPPRICGDRASDRRPGKGNEGGLPPWPPFSAGSLERKHVSLDSASAAPSRVVEVAASCTAGEARTLTRRELTRPPIGLTSLLHRDSPGSTENRFNDVSHGRLAQLVEHLVYTEGVGGSSPSPPIRDDRRLPQRRPARTPRRRRPLGGQQRQTPPSPTRPWRLPPTQPRTPPDRCHPGSCPLASAWFLERKQARREERAAKPSGASKDTSPASSTPPSETSLY